jgi:cytoskeletal protein CcmA (bactofilin family)|tara:strand:- start:531 stop:935 length:405 start_codon:yes stop_codon:yes gene_type:complete
MSLLKNINNNISSIIGPEMEIDGNVSVNGDLLIYGTIHGDVKSDGEIISAKNSTVNGNIESKNASISGIVKGNLIIKSKVILKKDAHLMGDLKASIITLEEGAKFDGMCSMVKQEEYNNATTNPSSLDTANEQA